MRINLDRSASVPLYEQLTSELRNVIASGQIAPGDQLPPIRQLAGRLGLGIATTRKALAELVMQGWLVARHGSGTYVSQSAALQSNYFRFSPPVVNDLCAREVLECKPESASVHLPPGQWGRRMQNVFDGAGLYSRYDESVDIDFRAGTPPVDLLDGTRWQELIGDWMKEINLTTISDRDPAGMPALRAKIAAWLNVSRGIQCSKEDIVIVSGAQQARSLVARLLVDETSRVVVEDPGSIFARLMFKSYGADLVPVHVDDSGLLVDELEGERNASLLYLTPSAQFPTGAVLSQSRRKRIAQWAKANNAIIIEDDNNSEFVYESRTVPAVHSFDVADQTIYIGTFAQILMPSLRIGFMVVPPRLREPLIRLKWLSDRCTSPLVQQLVLRMIDEGYLAQHLKRAWKFCAARRTTLLNALAALQPDLARFTPVKGGLHQTIWLPATIDDTIIFDECFRANVGVLPVSPCHLRGPARPGLMLSFGNLSDDRIGIGIQRLQQILEKHHGT